MKTFSGVVGACGVLVCGSLVQAAVMAQSPGGPSYTPMYPSNDGASKSLSEVLWNFTDPVSHQSAPITSPDGTRLLTGDLSRGETPASSDQLGYQRFLVSDQDAELQLNFLNGYAGYQSVVGVYTYAVGSDPITTALQYTPLFTQNVNPTGSSYVFVVPKDHYFGFYIDTDANRSSRGIFYTENFRNLDGSSSQPTQHFVMFQSNRGLLLAAEDLRFNPSTGRMGDQDYNDLMMTVTYSNGTPWTPVPEPATLALIAAGGALLLMDRKRRPQKK